MYQLQIEKIGIPTVTVVTSEFIGLANSSMQSLGVSDMSFTIIPHPVGGIKKEVVIQKADAAFKDILKAATTWQPKAGAEAVKKGYYPSERIRFNGSIEDVNGFFLKQKWSDGLPLIPPTEEKVKAMLAATSYPPDKVFLKLPPSMAGVTVELIAVNAVMAGCRPEYMPVLVSAFELLGKEAAKGWNLRQTQVTTNPVSLLLMVSGPIAKELGIQSGVGLIGPGWEANATIGRAFKMVLDNVGGSHAPDTDMSTHGQSGDFTMCIAESDETPWQTLREQLGVGKENSAVIIFPVAQRRNVNDHWNTTGKGILANTAWEMATIECPLLRSADVLVVLGPEHASTIKKDGWDLENIRRYLYEWGRVPLASFVPSGGGWARIPKWIADAPKADSMIPVVDRPENVLISVAGGAGKHSMLFLGIYGHAIGGPVKK